ncbi:DNA topoisomerase 3 (plasmid) [Robbsia andropogonis]|uniref:DNA topoisomerase 3 n=1 Tax=Robbsia andropogonis TaxID=28092 RepID=UPI003D261D3B
MRLFLCEKPSQAKDLAQFVGARERGAGAFTGPDVAVTWCIGHLPELAKPEHYEPRLSAWRLEYLPVLPDQWVLQVKDSVKAQYNAVAKWLKQASEVVIATDADREGEVIAREVMDLVGYRGRVKRLWLSALDASSVKKGLANLWDGRKTETLYRSGLGRARADWLAGMNLTMALTCAFGAGGKGGTLHFGRVQTPVLALIVRRQRAIDTFVPVAHFDLAARFALGGAEVPMRWQIPKALLDEHGRLLDQAVATATASRVSGQTGLVDQVSSTPEKEPAPLLYSLGSLQRDASAIYGLKAQAVLDACQALYETHKATTYPRTDCEYLPVSMFSEVPDILASVRAVDPSMAALVDSAQTGLATGAGRAFNDKRITAHHAIIPTRSARVQLSALSKTEQLVYDLIRRRYLMQFMGDYRFQKSVIEVVCAGERFRATGSVPIAPGWKAAALAGKAQKKSKDDGNDADAEVTLPSVEIGASARNLACTVQKKLTQPPKRYTEGTLLQAMESIDKEIDDPRLKAIMRNKEKAGIGTDATRAGIIENLFKRDYIANDAKKKSEIVPQAKGIALINLLEKFAPRLVDPVLTAEWEDKLSQIEAGQVELKQFETELGDWVRTLTVEVSKKAAEHRLTPAPGALSHENAPPCPACDSPMRRIKGTKGFFWGCSAYQSGCKTTLPDVDGKPGARASASADSRPTTASVAPAGAAHPCPACGAPLRRRESQRGAFWGCSTFPSCRHTSPDVEGRPDAHQEHAKRVTAAPAAAPAKSAAAVALNVGSSCPQCGKGQLVLRSQKDTARTFLGCTHFPACRFFKWSAQNMP